MKKKIIASIDDRPFESLTLEELNEKSLFWYGTHYREPTEQEREEILKEYNLR